MPTTSAFSDNLSPKRSPAPCRRTRRMRSCERDKRGAPSGRTRPPPAPAVDCRLRANPEPHRWWARLPAAADRGSVRHRRLDRPDASRSASAAASGPPRAIKAPLCSGCGVAWRRRSEAAQHWTWPVCVTSSRTGRFRCEVGSEQLVVGSRQIAEAGISRTEWIGLDPGATRSPGVQAKFGRDRLRSSPRVAIALELASPARRPVLRLGCHRLETSGPLRGPTRKRTRREPERSI
jgi:hypothetical protein